MSNIEKRLAIIKGEIFIGSYAEEIEDLFYEDEESIREIDYAGNNYWHTKYSSDFHRDNDLPAFISVDGDLYWYQRGNKHRENDKPAIVFSDGTVEWWYHGKKHRINDQPAIINANGSMEFWENGIRIK